MQRINAIFIENLKIHLYCGETPEERNLGVDVNLNLKANVGSFVNYEDVYKTILEISEGKFRYLEDFADRLIDKLTERFNVTEITLKLSKLSVPFRNSFESIGIEVMWKA